MNLCAQCAQHERTCCQRTEIFVTQGDRQRITAYTGKGDFWGYRRPEDPEYWQEQPHDPI